MQEIHDIKDLRDAEAKEFYVLCESQTSFVKTDMEVKFKKYVTNVRIVVEMKRDTIPVLTSGNEEKRYQFWYTNFCCQMGQTQDLHYL